MDKPRAISNHKISKLLIFFTIYRNDKLKRNRKSNKN